MRTPGSEHWVETLVIHRRFVATAIWCREIAIPVAVLAVLVTASSTANNLYSLAVADVTPVAPDVTASAASVPLSGELVTATINRATINRATTSEAVTPATANATDASDMAAPLPGTPVVSTSVVSTPVVSAAAANEPVTNEPVTSEAATSQPEMSQASTNQSVAKGPVLAALETPEEKLTTPSLAQTAQPNNVAGPQTGEVYDAVSSIEIHDECLVIDMCADRYLWQLYQRTPKEDSIRETRSKQVTKQVKVKKKLKTITVTQSWTVTIDEDFGWKDPKAAKVVSMSLADYVIGGVDRSFKLRLFSMLHAADEAGLAPGITSGFRDDYRQSIASGLKAASNRSYHGGSLRGGYGHGLAADIVSVKGATRGERLAQSRVLWKWVDDHGSEFGIGRPYLDRDPPHVAPVDGEEFAHHRPGAKTRQAAN